MKLVARTKSEASEQCSGWPSVERHSLTLPTGERISHFHSKTLNQIKGWGPEIACSEDQVPFSGLRLP
jgi:hypothetical protein